MRFLRLGLRGAALARFVVEPRLHFSVGIFAGGIEDKHKLLVIKAGDDQVVYHLALLVEQKAIFQGVGLYGFGLKRQEVCKKLICPCP